MDNEKLMQQLQSGQQIDTSSLGIDTDAMMQQVETLLLWGTLASVAILIPFLILYVLSARRKSKAYKAIIDIQKTLHEMNERDKGMSATAAPVTPPNETVSPKIPVIAQSAPTSRDSESNSSQV